MAFDYSSINLEEMLARAHSQMDELQRPGVSKAKKSGRCIFDMYMGTGKTFTALTAGLCFKPQRWIIICSKGAINAFRQEIKKWFPELGDDTLFTIVRGTKAEREAAYKSSGLFFCTTGGSFLRDLDFLVSNNIAFDVVTIDEADRIGLRNHKTKTYKSIKELTSAPFYQRHIKRLQKIGKLKEWRSKVSLVNICTGTLTSKGVPQLFGYLHLMDPKLFSSYWKFLGTFMHIVDGPFGRVPTVPRNTEGLAMAMAPYLHRITEKDAADVLPPLRRIKLPFELSPKIKDLYNQMSEELYFLILESETNPVQAVSSTLAQSIRLRQLLCCPSIIDRSLGAGDAIEACVDKILEDSEDPQFTHNVVFTPFLASIPVFKDYLSDRLSLAPSKIITMQGGMEPEEVQAAELQFRNDPQSMVICSTLFAASFNLESGRNCYHPHFDWNQDNNKQAESRIRRKTSNTQRTVMSYYCDVPNSISSTVLDVLNNNTRVNNITYQDVSRLKQQLLVRL